MKMKTETLTGAALDWAVASCERAYRFSIDTDDLDGTKRINYGGMYPEWSTDWAYGGPIIEREGIALDPVRSSGVVEAWCAARVEHPAFSQEYGPTPLIAAMRCYVAAMLGDEVDVPDELTGVNK